MGAKVCRGASARHIREGEQFSEPTARTTLGSPCFSSCLPWKSVSTGEMMLLKTVLAFSPAAEAPTGLCTGARCAPSFCASLLLSDGVAVPSSLSCVMFAITPTACVKLVSYCLYVHVNVQQEFAGRYCLRKAPVATLQLGSATLSARLPRETLRAACKAAPSHGIR